MNSARKSNLWFRGVLQTFFSSHDNNSSCGWIIDEWIDGNIQTSWTFERTELSQPLGASVSADHQEGTHLNNATRGWVRCMHTPACLALSTAAWPLVVVVVCRILLPRDYLHLALSPKQTLGEVVTERVNKQIGEHLDRLLHHKG